MILIPLISLISLCCVAQEDSLRVLGARNAVFIELLGSGFFYSFNYERVFLEGFTVRAGAGYTGNDGWFSEIWTLPVSTSYLI